MAQHAQRIRPESPLPQSTPGTLLRAIVLIVAVGILMRLAPLLVRALAGLVRILWRSTILVRGTPVLGLLFLLGVAAAVFLILRRGNARRR